MYSLKFGPGIVVRTGADTPWDVEVLYEKNIGSLLYYGMAWGHDLVDGKYMPELYEECE